MLLRRLYFYQRSWRFSRLAAGRLPPRRLAIQVLKPLMRRWPRQSERERPLSDRKNVRATLLSCQNHKNRPRSRKEGYDNDP